MMTLFNRLRDWRRRRALRARLDEELAFHLEELTREFEAKGHAKPAAQRLARIKLGNTTLVQEAHRERAGLPVVEEWWRDGVLAVRNLRRRPGYAVSMIGMLGLGLTATLTILVLTEGMMREALPVPRAHELHLVSDREGNPSWFSRLSVERLQTTWSEGAVMGYGGDTRVTVQRGGQPARRASGQLVLGNAWAGLELGVVAGRLFNRFDDEIGAGASVAVANHAWAVAEYGSPEAAVGQELLVNRQPLQIIGVLPERFRGFDGLNRVDLFFPASLQPLLAINSNANEFGSDDRPNDPDWNRESRVRWLEVLVRVPKGVAAKRVTPAVAEAAAPAIQDVLSEMRSPYEREALRNRTWWATAAPGGFSHTRNAFAEASRLLTALVLSLLVLTCANLSGLTLARTLARHREMGVRLSLGAGRWRTCRLALVEALVCGVAGALLAMVGVHWILPLAQNQFAAGADVTLAPWQAVTLTKLAGVALLCGLGCALIPAWWLSRLQPLIALKGSLGGGQFALRMGRGLVAVQLALAVMLAAVAFSLGREIDQVLSQDLGFEQDTTLTARFDVRTAGYTEEDFPSLYARLKSTAESVVGVERVGFSATGILSNSRMASTTFARGEGVGVTAESFQTEIVDVDYPGAVGLKLERGRWFSETDTEDSPRVAVVSQAFARRVWGTTEVLGNRIGFGFEPSDEDMEIVGVMSDARLNRAREDQVEAYLLPAPQFPAPLSYVAVRVSRDPEAVRERLAEAFRSVEPGLVFGSWQTLGERVDASLRRDKASSRLAGVVAGLALLLGVFGVGGSLAHLVALRQRELAVRIALGATPDHLQWGVLKDGARLGGWGALGGAVLIGGVFLGGWVPMASNPIVVAIAMACGFGAALVGGWIPARRAAKVDPIEMLKSD